MVKHTFRVERVYGINGKCRLYVALQSHGRSLRRCSSERTHPQRSPLGRCLGAPKWQMDFCKLPNQITRIILAERSNLTFTRSGATASSLCLSHDSDFGGGRLSCDFEEENEHFSEYSTVSKTTKSKTVIRIFMKPRRQKGFLSSQPKSLFFSLLCGTFCLSFIVVTPASDECLDFGHLPAVIGVLLSVCVCLLINDEEFYR